jgi:cysteine desulfurase
VIDLDANATTGIDPRVLEAMKPHLLAGGNPESRHGLGRLARKSWDESREAIASILGAHPDELILTSGGTESNNLALFGLVRKLRTATGNHVPVRTLVSEIEHPAVALTLIAMENDGLVLREIGPVLNEGRADTSTWTQRIGAEAGPELVTLMLANNETGAVQPIRELAAAAVAKGVLFHTDAVQAVGRTDVNFRELGVATLAAGSHKMHGPPGIGILLVRKDIRIAPTLFGGSQQKGIRPGTPPVGLAVGLAEALRLWHAERTERKSRWLKFGAMLCDGLRERLADTQARIVGNGPANAGDRLPQTVNLWIDHPSIEGEVLLMRLDLAGLAVSLGSACSSGSTKPSPVLLAMGLGPKRSKSSIRFSFSAFTTSEDIAQAIAILVTVIRDLTSESRADSQIESVS